MTAHSHRMAVIHGTAVLNRLLQTGNWQPVQGAQAHSATLASEGREGLHPASHQCKPHQKGGWRVQGCAAHFAC